MYNYIKLDKDNIFNSILFDYLNNSGISKTSKKQLNYEINPTENFSELYNKHSLKLAERDVFCYIDEDGIKTPYKEATYKPGNRKALKGVTGYHGDKEYFVSLKNITKFRDLTVEEKKHLKFSIEYLYSYEFADIDLVIEECYVTKSGEIYNPSKHLIFKLKSKLKELSIRFRHEPKKLMSSPFTKSGELRISLNNLIYNKPLSRYKLRESLTSNIDNSARNIASQVSFIGGLYCNENPVKWGEYSSNDHYILVDVDNGQYSEKFIELFTSNLNIRPHLIIEELGYNGTKMGNCVAVYRFDEPITSDERKEFVSILGILAMSEFDITGIDPQCTAVNLHKNPFTMINETLTHNVYFLDNWTNSYEDFETFLSANRNNITNEEKTAYNQLCKFITKHKDYKYTKLKASEIQQLDEFKEFTKQPLIVTPKREYRKSEQTTSLRIKGECLTSYSPQSKCSVGSRHNVMLTNTPLLIMSIGALTCKNLKEYGKFLYESYNPELVEFIYETFEKTLNNPENDKITKTEVITIISRCKDILYSYYVDDNRKWQIDLLLQMSSLKTRGNKNLIRHISTFIDNTTWENLFKFPKSSLDTCDMGLFPIMQEITEKYCDTQEKDKLAVFMKQKIRYQGSQSRHGNNSNAILSIVYNILKVKDIRNIMEEFRNPTITILKGALNTNKSTDYIKREFCNIVLNPEGYVKTNLYKKINDYNRVDIIDPEQKRMVLNLASLPSQLAINVICDILEKGKVEKSKHFFLTEDAKETLLFIDGNYIDMFNLIFDWCLDQSKLESHFNLIMPKSSNPTYKDDFEVTPGYVTSRLLRVINNVKSDKVVDLIDSENYEYTGKLSLNVLNQVLYINNEIRDIIETYIESGYSLKDIFGKRRTVVTKNDEIKRNLTTYILDFMTSELYKSNNLHATEVYENLRICSKTSYAFMAVAEYTKESNTKMGINSKTSKISFDDFYLINANRNRIHSCKFLIARENISINEELNNKIQLDRIFQDAVNSKNKKFNTSNEQSSNYYKLLHTNNFSKIFFESLKKRYTKLNFANSKIQNDLYYYISIGIETIKKNILLRNKNESIEDIINNSMHSLTKFIVIKISQLDLNVDISEFYGMLVTNMQFEVSNKLKIDYTNHTSISLIDTEYYSNLILNLILEPYLQRKSA